MSPEAARLAFAVQACLFLGIGIGRFSYTVLLPGLIDSGAVGAVEAGYIGSANLIGYLIGALLCAPLTRKLPSVPVLRACLALSVASFFACAVPLGFLWLLFWRALIGATAALLMVRAVALALAAGPKSGMGRVLGVAFAGVGLGTILSGAAVPGLLALGPSAAWSGLGMLGALAAGIAWNGWPAEDAGPREPAAPSPDGGPSAARRGSFPWLIVGHFLFGFGLAPPTIYWIDYMSRALGQGMASGGFLWGLVGIGAILGPMLCGLAAERIGFAKSTIAALAFLGLVVSMPLPVSALPWLALASIFLGALNPGTSTLMSGRTREVVPAHALGQAWARMTSSVSLGQGIGGLCVAALFAATRSYMAVFLLGSAAMLFASLACAVSSATLMSGRAKP